MEKFDAFAEKLIKEFEAKPIATSIKGLVLLWIVRKVYSSFK